MACHRRLPCWKFEGWPVEGTERIDPATHSRTNMTVSPAIAAFAAAGNDIDALEKAIEEASYLDATPGEDRQKLRGMHPAPEPALRCAHVPATRSCMAYVKLAWGVCAATRTRVKKLKKEAIAKAEAAAKDAATKGPKERSPFIKEVPMNPCCVARCGHG